MKILCLLLVATVPLVCSGLTVTPPKDQWVRVGQKAILVCQASTKVKACTWETPYKKTFTFFEGLQAEQGRLKHHATDDVSCGIEITNVKDGDIGAWTCTVNAAESGELKSESRVTYLNMAKKPESILLAEPFNMDTANLSVYDEKEVKCIVAHAQPKPVFSWYVGEEQLTGQDVKDETSADDTWIQTLTYNPSVTHANQTLRCVVEHVALEDSEKKEAGVMLHFTESGKEIIQALEKGEESVMALTLYPAVICTTFTLVVIIILTAIVIKIRNMYLNPAMPEELENTEDCTSPADTTNAMADFEKVDITEGGMVDEDDQMPMETTEEPKANRSKLVDRVTAFFASKKETTENKEEDEAHVVIDVPEEEKEASAEEDKKAKEPSAMVKFFGRFKMTKAEKKVEAEEVKKDDTEEKPVEYEPEEKPEAKEAEKDDANSTNEKPPPPMNTDV